MLNMRRNARRRGTSALLSALLGALLVVPAAGLGVAAQASASEVDPTTASLEATATPAAEEAASVAAEEPAPAAAEEPAPSAAEELSPAAVGDGTLNVTLAQKTGTPAFDADDAPGNDSSADNDIVRTNDTVAYTVSIRYEGEDQTNPAIRLTLPQGEELVQLPPFCLTGSTVTPPSAGDPIIPVTGTSYQSLPTQTVVCIVDNQTQGTALDYEFISKVRPEVPNGTALAPVTASATSDQVTTPAVSNSVEHTVSAAADFDVSKRATAVAENTGPYGQDPGVQECAFDTNRFCRTIYYPLTVDAPSGGKGITPLATPITLTDDLTPASFFGPTAWAQAVALAGSEAAAVEAYAPRLSECRDVQTMYAGLPYSRSNPTNRYSVTDSGAIDCQQPGGTGTPVNITITDADTTGYHVPDTIYGTGSAIDADTGYVISYEIKMQIPIDTIRDLGVVGADGVTKTLPTENTFVDVEMTDIAGNPNTGEVIANNNRTAVLSMRANEGGAGEFFDKFFSSPIGRAGNTPIWPYSIQQGFLYEGPPGSGTAHDGNTVVLPGQPVLSNLQFYSNNGVPQSGTEFSRSYVGCDVWDDAQLGLTPGSYAGGPSNLRPSDGDAAWISYFRNGVGETQPIADLRNLKIEYSRGAFGAGASSDCSTGTWYDSPAAVPGAVLDADGVYSGVNRVRVSFSSDYTGNGDTFMVNLAIGQTVRDTAGDLGDVIGNWGSRKWVEGVADIDGVITDPKPYDTSSYVPETHESSWGDRLTIGGVTARINKYVKNPGTGEFTDTAIPQYTAGSQVDYRLNPTLSADVPAGVTARAVVEDCLPPYQQFVSSVRASGAPITPALVQAGAPAGSELACPSGQTYVKWDLGELVVNAEIDPIIYTVDILETARNAVYTNTTLVSSPQDPSPASVRDDEAQIQLVLPTGVKIDKATSRPLVEINPDGVQTPRTLTWTVEFANIDSPVDVSDVDVIDVLPANGIGTTSFAGDLTFTSATVAAGTGITMLYTAAAPAGLNADPDHASNGASGAMVWCDAINGGTVVSGAGTAADCPDSSADVTGLRFLRPGDFAPADQMIIDIVMTPSGNDGGDIYENTTSGRAQGVTQPVGPASREIVIIESSIGDFVWEDLDADGIQDAGEPGVAGFPVTLVGVDLDGNPVSFATTTDANGRYAFPDLASGTYTVTFDPNGLSSNTTFTQQNAGSDDAIDSDGDVATGETAPFALAPNSVDPNWDQGLVIDRNVAITIDKRLVEQTVPDAKNRVTVTYELVVANAGTADGAYDLADHLKFGGNIEIDSVTASNTAPGDIVIDPHFDGIGNTTMVVDQAIGGGETHTYEVRVATTVATTITRQQGDCELTESEQGTGYLNAANLTVDGAVVIDTACGEVPPREPHEPSAGRDSLAHTGVSVAGAGIVAATLALIGGVLFVLRRRRSTAVSGE